MKSIARFTIITVLGLLLAHGSTHANSFAITANPIQLLDARLPMHFHLALGSMLSMQVSGYAHFGYKGLLNVKRDRKIGGGGGVSLKIHLGGESLSDSWFIKPGVRLGYINLADQKDKKGFAMGPEIIFGYDWVWDSGFMLSFGLGAYYEHLFIKSDDKEKKSGWDKFVGGLHGSPELSFGWAF